MMTTIKCGLTIFCPPIQRAFHDALTTYGFHPERCECEPGGRAPECRAFLAT